MEKRDCLIKHLRLTGTIDRFERKSPALGKRELLSIIKLWWLQDFSQGNIPHELLCTFWMTEDSKAFIHPQACREMMACYRHEGSHPTGLKGGKLPAQITISVIFLKWDFLSPYLEPEEYREEAHVLRLADCKTHTWELQGEAKEEGEYKVPLYWPGDGQGGFLEYTGLLKGSLAMANRSWGKFNQRPPLLISW